MTVVVRNFFLGFIKIHILHHAAQEEVYGPALITELRRHGHGKIRKYCVITRRGAAHRVGRAPRTGVARRRRSS
jgi:hypothetical protein